MGVQGASVPSGWLWSMTDLPGRQTGMGPGSEGDRCKWAVEPVSQALGDDWGEGCRVLIIEAGCR